MRLISEIGSGWPPFYYVAFAETHPAHNPYHPQHAISNKARHECAVVAHLDVIYLTVWILVS
ncbi:hypothetical protein LDG_8655 [Legionella drancourtii LLAP12]|uniref:Uncharacterized protein n=1 Tax=Legionella drancourtii LLAP12 TaxID=658187 RepID=G9ETM1_9GAMM|nr:hypothetical protein [Legionella drancourtii]EHL29222.1 hypothetical protein LDG_8655 [Legionella drancourtii LLAP12]